MGFVGTEAGPLAHESQIGSCQWFAWVFPTGSGGSPTTGFTVDTPLLISG